MKSEHKKAGPKLIIRAGIVRIFAVLFLGLIIYWLAYGLYTNDLVIPGKYGHVAHFHGPVAWFMAASVFCFAASMVSWFTLNKYRTLWRCLYFGGWGLLVAEAVFGIWYYHRR